VLPQERRVGVGVAAVEAGVLLEPLLAEHLPGAEHHLPVAHRRRVCRQHGLQRGAERPARAAAAGRRDVRRRLVRLAPAQQDPGVVVVSVRGGAAAVAVVAVEAELGAGVSAEERHEVVGDVVRRRRAHPRRARQVAKHRGVREEPGGARAAVEVGVGGGGGRTDLLLLLVDEAAAVARVGHHGEGGASRQAIHQLPEVHVCVHATMSVNERRRRRHACMGSA